MDIFLLIGIFLGFFSVIVGMIVKGANVLVLINPAAVIIIFVGVIAALVNSFPGSEIKRLPKIFGVLFKNKEQNAPKIIGNIVELANLARRDGLLALESSVESLEDPFLKKGLEMVVDGVDPEQIREIMENEIAGIEERHRVGAQMFKTAGAAAPTLGVLGAVIGLIGALGNLNDVDALGHMISAAFVATIYGIFFGYVILVPFGSRLTVKSEAEVQTLLIIIEGVMGIQAGQSPKTIEQKLFSLIEPNKRTPNE
ncbi:flagellar motor stator protein MotA [Enterococcus saccharolyticus]|uniref:flagellar motor stator protein MotA n=1 Tax=Enterococcus saccharolyticus TaxID=41997 RepID=UPI001E533D38|nr:flagellar motor stator protein MotA [Enterococcus saccharolyticus]MCD5002847.1 flagellar motor stator protein MotA [Enterococcus saccharolyticus]